MQRITIRSARCYGEMRVHAALAHPGHINPLLDGENQHGNCEKGAAKKAAPAKKRLGQEGGAGEEGGTAKKARGEEGARRKKRTPNAAFMKAMTPSPALAAIIGDKPVPRTEVTKKVWEYIKKNNLQDATKRTMINADAKLKEIFNQAPGLDVRDDQADQRPPELSRAAARRDERPVLAPAFFMARA